MQDFLLNTLILHEGLDLVFGANTYFFFNTMALPY
jgi:hypothetical protein